MGNCMTDEDSQLTHPDGYESFNFRPSVPRAVRQQRAIIDKAPDTAYIEAVFNTVLMEDESDESGHIKRLCGDL